MGRRGLLIVGVLVTLLVAVSAVLFWSANQRLKRAAAVESEIESVREENRGLQDSVRLSRRDADRAQKYSSFWIKQASSARQSRGMLLNEYDIADLRSKGLRDPVNDLRRALVSHPELIPIEGIHGGTMGFVEDSIALLSQRWVFAECEDGHIMARCLFSYEIAPDGSISWQVLAAAGE